MVCKCGHRITKHHLNKGEGVFTRCFAVVKLGYPAVSCTCVMYEEVS